MPSKVNEKQLVVILDRRKYHESSLIIKGITNNAGIVSYIAKGVLNQKGKQSGFYEPLNLVEIIAYGNQLQGLHLIKEISFIENFAENASYSKTMMLYVAGEIFTQLVFHPEDYANMFELYIMYAHTLKTTNYPESIIFWRFLVRLMQIMGYSMNLQFCVQCSSPLTSSVTFNLTPLGLLCNKCSTLTLQTLPVHDNVAQILLHLHSLSNINLEQLLTLDTIKETNRLWALILKNTFETPIYLKSLAMLGYLE